MRQADRPSRPGVSRRTFLKTAGARRRTKMFYVVGRDHVDLVEGSPTAQYWCSRTATVIGPDDVYCSADVCIPTRVCFEPPDEGPPA